MLLSPVSLCSQLLGTVYFQPALYFLYALVQDVWDGSTHTFDFNFDLIFCGFQRLEHISFKFATAHRVLQDGEYSRKAGKKLPLYSRLRKAVGKACSLLVRLVGKSLRKPRDIASDFYDRVCV